MTPSRDFLTSTKKTATHKIRTKIKFLWIVTYLKYVFHVVTVPMLSASSLKHSCQKISKIIVSMIIVSLYENF